MADNRIVGHCVGGGPLDNQFMSVAEDQLMVGGFGNMAMTDDGVFIEKYVKDESTVREPNKQEVAMLDYLFDHPFTQICEFKYTTE